MLLRVACFVCAGYVFNCCIIDYVGLMLYFVILAVCVIMLVDLFAVECMLFQLGLFVSRELVVFLTLVLLLGYDLFGFLGCLVAVC